MVQLYASLLKKLQTYLIALQSLWPVKSAILMKLVNNLQIQDLNAPLRSDYSI